MYDIYYFPYDMGDCELML